MQNPYHVNINLQSDSESLHIDLKTQLHYTAIIMYCKSPEAIFEPSLILYQLVTQPISNMFFHVFMVALWNRADHYIFILWFLSSIFFFSSPNLSGRRLDVCHTSTHGVALVRI